MGMSLGSVYGEHSIVLPMNMPPLPYLRRIPALRDLDLDDCFADAGAWDALRPAQVTLCSPDPQAFRPPEEKPNFLHVGLPTNFKAAAFEDDAHTAILRRLEDDIAGVRLEGKDVPVKLRLHGSPGRSPRRAIPPSAARGRAGRPGRRRRRYRWPPWSPRCAVQSRTIRSLCRWISG